MSDQWAFGPEAAAQLIAATSWPYEREENRESWAPKMLTDHALFEREAESAHRRLMSAIEEVRRQHAAKGNDEEGL
jgi:hypothetical protein